jgi:hypothetical protein
MTVLLLRVYVMTVYTKKGTVPQVYPADKTSGLSMTVEEAKGVANEHHFNGKGGVGRFTVWETLEPKVAFDLPLRSLRGTQYYQSHQHDDGFHRISSGPLESDHTQPTPEVYVV